MVTPPPEPTLSIFFGGIYSKKPPILFCSFFLRYMIHRHPSKCRSSKLPKETFHFLQQYCLCCLNTSATMGLGIEFSKKTTFF